MQQIPYLSTEIERRKKKRQIKNINSIISITLPADLALLIIINSHKSRATAELVTSFEKWLFLKLKMLGEFWMLLEDRNGYRLSLAPSCVA